MTPVEVTKKRERPKPKAGGRARNYLYTINFGCDDRGWTNGIPRLLDPEKWSAHNVKYNIYQLECGTDGTLHFQGYLECRGQKTMVQLHTLEGLEGAHFAVRQGSQQDNIRYCSKKDETYIEGPWEWGEKSEQGKRSDLLEIKEKLDKKVSLAMIADENFSSWIRHQRGFKEYKRITTKPRDFKSRVVLFVGPSGTGKSTLMKLIAQKLGSVYVTPQPKGSGVYFDDYDGQDVLILDEFDGSFMRPTFFNTLCDRHECVLPSHGAAGSQCISRFIFIGSNYIPKSWWKKRSASQLVQTTRRIDVVFKIGFKDIPAAPPAPPARIITVLARYPPAQTNTIVLPLSDKGKEELDDPVERR